MTIQQIKTFVTLFNNRSFAETAKEMYLTQSRVSQQIKALEKELSCQLFERTNHKVIATDNGSTFYTYAQNILANYFEGLYQLKDNQKKFYVHTMSQRSYSPIMLALLKLSYECPDADYKVLKPYYSDNLATDKYSQGHLYLFRKKWVNGTDLSFFSLGKPYYSVVFKRGDPLYGKKEVFSLEDLSDRLFIVPTPDNSPDNHNGPYLGHIKAVLAQENIKYLTAGNTPTTLSKVLSGNYDCVGVLSNKVTYSDDIPLVSARLDIPDDDYIGFAYTGELTPYMKRYMEIAKKIMDEQ